MKLCDAHIHIVSDPASHSMIATRTYTPGPATIESLQKLAVPHGITRFVVVQPSFYGTDNTVTLKALAALGMSGAGVAVLDADSIGEAELQSLAEAHIRGVRINLYTTHGVTMSKSLAERFAATAKLCARMDWHVQVIAPLPMLRDVAEMLAKAPVPVVIDHYGLPGGFTPDSAEGRRLLELLRLPHVWMKLSAPYRSTGNALAVTPDPAWLQNLLHVSADRCLWGSDWPHTPAHEQQTGDGALLPYRALDYAAVVEGFRSALPDSTLADKIMGTNPERLYRFES